MSLVVLTTFLKLMKTKVVEEKKLTSFPWALGNYFDVANTFNIKRTIQSLCRKLLRGKS